MTTAFQPNAFQVNPLAFQISQIGSARSGVMRQWLIAAQTKALEEKKARELPPQPPTDKQPLTVATKKPKRKPARRVWGDDEPPLEIPLFRPRAWPESPTVFDHLAGVTELPTPSVEMLSHRRQSATVIDLAEARRVQVVKTRRVKRRKKAALLMLLAA